jgi:hypothetical protein
MLVLLGKVKLSLNFLMEKGLKAHTKLAIKKKKSNKI